MSLVGEVKGRLIALDVQGERICRYISIYAPNNSTERKRFFGGISKFVVDNTFLLGDFNSVVSPHDHLSGNLDSLHDHLSGNLDPTSEMLCQLLESLDFHELPGPQQKTFTYYHPTVQSRKSHLDHIYMNFDNKLLHGYCSPIFISDHYLVGMFSLPDTAQGPKQWRFPNDLLLDVSFNQQVHLTLENFDKDNPLESWERIKLKVQCLSQRMTVLRQRQAQHEISSLCSILSEVNKRIFDGDNLDVDRICIEARLEQCLDKRNFLLSSER